jgi:hypothetical protein
VRRREGEIKEKIYRYETCFINKEGGKEGSLDGGFTMLSKSGGERALLLGI